MIKSRQYLDCIINDLNIIRSEIKSRNLLNLIDDNIVMQNFMCDMLNMVYGYDLKNLNTTHSNFPGIDLGDEDREIGFQITATKSGKKIKDTIDVCIRNKCCHKYRNIKVFILTEKQSSYTMDYTNKLFSFNVVTDIYDFDDIYSHILSSVDILGKEQLYEYIKRESPSLLSSFGVSLYDDDVILREIFFEVLNNEIILDSILSYFEANHLSEIVLYPDDEEEWWVFNNGTPPRSVKSPGGKGIHSLKVSTIHKNKIPLLKSKDMRENLGLLYKRYDIYCLANGFDKATAVETSKVMKDIRNKYGEWLT